MTSDELDMAKRDGLDKNSILGKRRRSESDSKAEVEPEPKRRREETIEPRKSVEKVDRVDKP
jgi:hypothetical protein